MHVKYKLYIIDGVVGVCIFVYSGQLCINREYISISVSLKYML